MPAQVLSTVENNFTKGFVTEFTGLNFPENAATDTDNCLYDIVGHVTRRLGLDYETNHGTAALNRGGRVVNTYKWNNAGGDGDTKIVVTQVGATLSFYLASATSSTSPLSAHKVFNNVDITQFQTGATPDPATLECQFADGNGYLFVYHPRCQPFFCSYDAATGAVTPNIITLNVRDFTGIPEPGRDVTDRPNVLSIEHLYNLTNQGWTQGASWNTVSSGSGPSVQDSGTLSFTVPAGLPGVDLGSQISIANLNSIFGAVHGRFVPAGTPLMSGTLASYSGTTMNITITASKAAYLGEFLGPYVISPFNVGYINTWQSAVSNYPSNSDVWWYFKDNNGIYNPTTKVSQVTINNGNAPRGHYLLDAFNQDRSLISSVVGLTTISTSIRPRTGAWFQGRVWYAGTDASQTKTGDADFYTWTENIYFSQIATNPDQFGKCFQNNDPTSETLFDLLPTDGGVITIQGAGAIYKLFPIQNGMLVFAANGIWFITGSQGIGFTANDYTITKISSVRNISGTSFVDVNGLPYFWNEEGIYAVQPAQQGGLTVEPITIGTILSYYEDIPSSSKRFARGSYDPVNYTIQWIFRSQTDGDNLTSRYEYDKILNFNTYNKAFFPYTIGGTASTFVYPKVSSIAYVDYPTVSNVATPGFKYFVSAVIGSEFQFTFADEHDTGYVDWRTYDNVGVSYDSHFVTGYKLHGQGQRRFQIPYIYIFSNAEEETAYQIQSIWDYASSRLSGRYSSAQTIYNNKPYFGMIFRRHRLRGQGIVLQIKVTSVDGKPFDIMGWSTFETANQGV
jgi:hypothetical protein